MWCHCVFMLGKTEMLALRQFAENMHATTKRRGWNAGLHVAHTLLHSWCKWGYMRWSPNKFSRSNTFYVLDWKWKLSLFYAFQLLGIIPAQAIATLMGKSDTTRHGEEQVQYSIFRSYHHECGQVTCHVTQLLQTHPEIVSWGLLFFSTWKFHRFEKIRVLLHESHLIFKQFVDDWGAKIGHVSYRPIRGSNLDTLN